MIVIGLELLIVENVSVVRLYACDVLEVYCEPATVYVGVGRQLTTFLLPMWKRIMLADPVVASDDDGAFNSASMTGFVTSI
jgi:precorrin-6B methylase 2